MCEWIHACGYVKPMCAYVEIRDRQWVSSIALYLLFEDRLLVKPKDHLFS